MFACLSCCSAVMSPVAPVYIVAISMCIVAVKQYKLIQCGSDVCIYVYVKRLRIGVVANLLSDACSLS